MTIEQRMEHLEFEIERLNLRNRRWRRLACTMAVLIVASVGIGAAQMNEDELTLRKLVIQDEEGRDRIVLKTSERGAGIVHLDANGKMRISSDTNANGLAFTSLYDANGEVRISTMIVVGLAKTSLSDANGEARIVSATSADGEAFTLWSEYDANGKIQPVKVLP